MPMNNNIDVKLEIEEMEQRVMELFDNRQVK